MFPIMLLLFTVVPATEFYILYKVGGQIGAFNTFVLIVLTGVVGATLAKTQGLIILFKVQNELAKGEMPASQIIHGFLVFGGGLLLLTPGFITDILGFSMVVPGTRHLIVKALSAYFKQAIAKGTLKFASSSNVGGTNFKFYSSSFNSQSSTDPSSSTEGLFKNGFSSVNSHANPDGIKRVKTIDQNDVIEVSSRIRTSKGETEK